MLKKSLLLLPLLVVSCTGTLGINENTDGVIDDTIYENVDYFFSIDKHCYVVYIDKDTQYNVPPSNYYEIKYTYYKEDFTHVTNEYFVKTNELFVYLG